MGHPYIASLLLGSLALKRLRLKGVLRCSLALFCLLQSYFQASENRLTKGSKGPFVTLRVHYHVWMGSMLYKAFCLVYHRLRPNICEHRCMCMYLASVKFHEQIFTKTVKICLKLCWKLLKDDNSSILILCKLLRYNVIKNKIIWSKMAGLSHTVHDYIEHAYMAKVRPSKLFLRPFDLFYNQKFGQKFH